MLARERARTTQVCPLPSKPSIMARKSTTSTLQKVDSFSSETGGSQGPPRSHGESDSIACHPDSGNSHDRDGPPIRSTDTAPTPREYSRRNRQMTFGTVLHLAQGLMEVLINRHNYYQVGIDIYEAGIDRIGGGV